MATLSQFRDRLRSKFEYFETTCERLNRSQLFYLVGIVFGILAVFWHLTPFHDIFLTAIWASGLLLTCGLISDLLAIYKTVWDTIIGKGSLLLVYAASTNVAYAMAARIVNELVKFDTSTLTYSVNLVAVLLAPAFILLGTCAALTVVLVLGQFYLMTTTYSKQLRENKCLSRMLPQSAEEYPGITFAVRVVVFPIVFGMLWASVPRVAPGYGKFIEETATAFIFNFEASHYSRCEIEQNSRAIRVTEKEIIVVSHSGNGYRFEPKKCIPLNKALTLHSRGTGRMRSLCGL